MSINPSVYTLVERISNLLRNELRAAGGASQLEPVHLQALDYLDRANAYSNTPLAVAEYLGLSKGNISQRLIALEREGYLKRGVDKADRRISHLLTTAKGQSVLKSAVPPPTWRQVLARLPTDETKALHEGLVRLLRQLQAAQGQRSFGVCHTCRFFLREATQFRCGVTKEPLAVEQTSRICREHEPH